MLVDRCCHIKIKMGAAYAKTWSSEILVAEAVVASYPVPLFLRTGEARGALRRQWLILENDYHCGASLSYMLAGSSSHDTYIMQLMT